MSIFSIIRHIWFHPFNKNGKLNAILRFIRWQFFSRLLNYQIIYPLTYKSSMIVNKGMTGITGCIYNGLLEFEDMMFLLHFLRKQDTFVDVGANVGVYTILASSEIGSKVISIEPIKKTFDILSQNVLLNKAQENVLLLNIGVGEKKQKLSFSTTQDTMNHVLTDKELKSSESEIVQIETLDDILIHNVPKIIKIDVEGFETNVINGAHKILSNESLKAIIIELNGAGSLYGFDDDLLHSKILSFGFKCFSYEPYQRVLKKIDKYGEYNTIYIRDFNFVKDRIMSSPQIKILNKSI